MRWRSGWVAVGGVATITWVSESMDGRAELVSWTVISSSRGALEALTLGMRNMLGYPRGSDLGFTHDNGLGVWISRGAVNGTAKVEVLQVFARRLSALGMSDVKVELTLDPHAVEAS